MSVEPAIRLRLKIKNSDDSVYWTEHFSSLESLYSWLSEEESRPYWDSSRTYEILVLDNQDQETPYEE